MKPWRLLPAVIPLEKPTARQILLKMYLLNRLVLLSRRWDLAGKTNSVLDMVLTPSPADLKVRGHKLLHNGATISLTTYSVLNGNVIRDRVVLSNGGQKTGLVIT